jgi:hypothetical protein
MTTTSFEKKRLFRRVRIEHVNRKGLDKIEEDRKYSYVRLGHSSYVRCHIICMETAVAQWLRFCATNRKVAGSIPDGVTGTFH